LVAVVAILRFTSIFASLFGSPHCRLTAVQLAGVSTATSAYGMTSLLSFGKSCTSHFIHRVEPAYLACFLPVVTIGAFWRPLCFCLMKLNIIILCVHLGYAWISLITITLVYIFHLLFTSWLPIMVFYAADAFGIPSQCHRMCNLIEYTYASVLSAIGYQPLSEAHLAHFLCLTDAIASVHRHGVVGGHKTRIIKYKDISAFIKSGALQKCSDIQSKEFCFIDYIDPTTTNEYSADSYLHLKFPMDKLVHFIPPAQARQLAKMHGVETGPRTSIAQLRLLFEDHGACNICTTHITIVSMQSSQKEHISMQRKKLIGNKTVEEKHLMHVQAQKRLTKH
jgi:energy-coupling factor transporter transmembrane protein EcfT